MLLPIVKSLVLTAHLCYVCEVNILFPDPTVTYSDKLRNRDGREMTGKKTDKSIRSSYFQCLESEKFHEMASATEAPPKTCFLLDDDGEFPPVAFAAS